MSEEKKILNDKELKKVTGGLAFNIINVLVITSVHMMVTGIIKAPIIAYSL